MSGLPPFAAAVRDRRTVFSAAARLAGALFAVGLFASFPALAAAAPESSELMPLAPRALLLDVAAAGSRLVAVGDRGHVLLSDDQGATWRQVTVPTRAMLTGVDFADDQHGCAVGHDGVILVTADAGTTWTRRDDGRDLETVWLDVRFTDANEAVAVGAYGRYAVSADRGLTWQPAHPIEDESHFNQLAVGAGGLRLLAGETGTLLLSRDRGTHWVRAELPYDGSLFGSVILQSGPWVIHGLRGHVLVSEDNGATWAERATPVQALLQAGLETRAGVLVLAGQGGNFLLSRDHGRTFTAWKPAAYNGSVAALRETADGILLVIGELGVARLALPEAPRP